MNTSIAPTAAEVWPQVATVSGRHLPGQIVALKIPDLSQGFLLSALSDAIHDEMRGAGEWAARMDEPQDKFTQDPKLLCHWYANRAGQLLAIYTTLHRLAYYTPLVDRDPRALKASASRRYLIALRETRTRLGRRGKSATPPSPTLRPE